MSDTVYNRKEIDTKVLKTSSLTVTILDLFCVFAKAQ